MAHIKNWLLGGLGGDQLVSAVDGVDSRVGGPAFDSESPLIASIWCTLCKYKSILN